MSKNATNKKSLESRIEQLSEYSEWFYSDEFNLDEALDKYKESMQLAKDIEQDLATLKNQVEVIGDFAKE